MNQIEQNILLSSNRYHRQKLYWLSKLSGDFSETLLVRGLHRRSDGHLERFNTVFSSDIVAQIDKICKDSHLSVYIFLLATMKAVIYRFTGNQDVVIGSPVLTMKRSGDRLNNVVLLRDHIQSGMTFRELLFQVRETTLEAYDYQDYPFEKLSEHFNQSLHKNGVPFIHFLFRYQAIHHDDFQNIDSDLQLTLERDGGLLKGEVTFNTAVYSTEIIARFIESIFHAVESVLANVNVPVSNIQLCDEKTRRQLLEDFNNTQSGFPADKTLIQLFESRMADFSEKYGIICGAHRIPYAELDRKANQLACFLKQRGVKPETIIGLLTTPSPETMIGILGILKAGCSFLPVDPALPNNRILSILDDSETSVIITNQRTVEDLSFTALQKASDDEAEMEVTSPRAQITDINDLPIPDRSLVNYEKYNRLIGQALVKNTIALQATRGCPYNCIYCHKIWPKSHVFRSAENILAEIELYYNMGVRRFVFVDDVFNLHHGNSSRLFQQIIAKGLKVQLFFPNGLRGDILTKEYIDLMVEAGTVNISLALETASPRLQKLIHKNLNLEKLYENLGYIASKHPQVILEVAFMHGFPTETEEEALMTLDFIKSIQWIHFPHLNILKIFPGSEMEELALQNGITKEMIHKSVSLAYHELPETLPFPKTFTSKFQIKYLDEYFLLKERLLKVLPVQMRVMKESELVEKYNSYLPVEIKSFDDLLAFFRINQDELGAKTFLDESYGTVPDLNQKLRKTFPREAPAPNAVNILLLDLSQHFENNDPHKIYDVVEPPLGLMYQLTYLRCEMGNQVNGRIAKSRIDFENYGQLKTLIQDFKPDIIGIRTLTYFREFFHQTVSLIRQWGINVPILAGGPYATSGYKTLLSDGNIDLAILGEGEITFTELIRQFIQSNKTLTHDVLKSIPGIAFRKDGNPFFTRATSRTIVLLDELVATENCDNIPKREDDPKQPAYMIYTSGTTGKPKGVIIENRSLVNYINWFSKKVGLTSQDRTVLLSSYAFDLGYTGIFPALYNGCELHLVGKELYADPEQLLRYIHENQITFIKLTPSLFSTIVNTYSFSNSHMCHSLRLIVLGGEPYNIDDIEKYHRLYPGCQIINHYGPTETTIGTITHRIDFDDIERYRQDTVIGRPIDNANIFILDKDLNPVPPGIPGEIYVAGAGLARGYLKNPDIERQKFIVNPFSRTNERLYKTGDLGKYLPDGNIAFLGRGDQQVKIRGYRIELQEIERVILQYKWVQEAHVLAKNDLQENNVLYAYIVAEESLSIPELKSYLSDELPDYMIPSYFIRLSKIPLTPNGKIDTKALLEHSFKEDVNHPYIPPGDETEAEVAALWSELLGKERISVCDNFFEIGGHSLKATLLMSKIQSSFRIAIPLQEIFRTPTIRHIAAYIKEASGDQELTAHHHMVLIKKCSAPSENLFLIHDGTGEIEGYYELSNRLNVNMNIWGLTADRSISYPRNGTFEALAAQYIERIKHVQHHGPYRIAGWSIGGTIAYEIARQLEQSGEDITLVLIDSTPPSLRNAENAIIFSPGTELSFVNEFIEDDRMKKNLEEITELKEFWPQIIEMIQHAGLNLDLIIKKVPEESLKIIPNYQKLTPGELIYYVNNFRTFRNLGMRYVPGSKIKSTIHYFKAANSITINENTWNAYCLNPIKVYPVNGDHYSILREPCLHQLSDGLTSVLAR